MFTHVKFDISLMLFGKIVFYFYSSLPIVEFVVFRSLADYLTGYLLLTFYFTSKLLNLAKYSSTISLEIDISECFLSELDLLWADSTTLE